MDPSYFPPSTRKVEPQYAINAGFYLVATLSLLIRNRIVRFSLAFPAYILLFWTHRRFSSGDTGQDYATAFFSCYLLIKWFDFALLHVPEQSFAREQDNGELETPTEVQQMTPWRKAKWSGNLFSSFRGVGWNWCVKNIDHMPKGTSRRSFLLQKAFHITYCTLYNDFREWCMKWYFPANLGSGATEFLDLSLKQQLFLTWLFIFSAGFSMSMFHSMVAVIAVGSGLASPDHWPPMFGHAYKGYTMRNIWGQCWHQLFRRIFETYNDLLTTTFGIRKGTIFSKYSQLYNAFFVSALMHHMGAMNLPYIRAVRSQFLFFMLQAVFITIEDAGIALGKKAGIKPSWRTKLIGFCWVFAVLSYTSMFGVRYMIDCHVLEARNPVLFRGVFDKLLG